MFLQWETIHDQLRRYVSVTYKMHCIAIREVEYSTTVATESDVLYNRYFIEQAFHSVELQVMMSINAYTGEIVSLVYDRLSPNLKHTITMHVSVHKVSNP